MAKNDRRTHDQLADKILDDVWNATPMGTALVMAHRNLVREMLIRAMRVAVAEVQESEAVNVGTD